MSKLLPVAVPSVLISWSFKFAAFHFVLRIHAVRNSNLLDWIVRYGFSICYRREVPQARDSIKSLGIGQYGRFICTVLIEELAGPCAVSCTDRKTDDTSQPKTSAGKMASSISIFLSVSFCLSYFPTFLLFLCLSVCLSLSLRVYSVFISLPLPSPLPFLQLLSSFVSRCCPGNHLNLLLPLLLKPRATSSVWLRVSFCEKYDYNGTILYAPVIKDTGFSRHAKLLFVN